MIESDESGRTQDQILSLLRTTRAHSRKEDNISHLFDRVFPEERIP